MILIKCEECGTVVEAEREGMFAILSCGHGKKNLGSKTDKYRDYHIREGHHDISHTERYYSRKWGKDVKL